MAEKARLWFVTIAQWSSSCHRLIQAQKTASVEACAILTPLFGIGRKKMPYYPVPTPNLRLIQP